MISSGILNLNPLIDQLVIVISMKMLIRLYRFSVFRTKHEICDCQRSRGFVLRGRVGCCQVAADGNDLSIPQSAKNPISSNSP